MRETVDEALDALRRGDWIEDDQEYCAHLCLEEALVNAVSHGNKNDPDLNVVIKMTDEGDECKIQVRDEGQGFDPEDINLPPAESLGGRGVFLIKCFMKNVTFDVKECCLQMVLPRKALKKGGAGDE